MLYTVLSLTVSHAWPFFSSLVATFFSSDPWNTLLTVVFMLSGICPYAFWILKPVGNLCSPPQAFPCFVLGVGCAMVIQTVGIFGWNPPEDSLCGESTQKPPFPAELQEIMVVEGGRRTEDISSGNALGLFQLARPVLAGLKGMLGSQGLVDTNVFWNRGEKEMSA